MRQIPNFSDYNTTINGRIWSKPRKGKGCPKNGKWLKPNKMPSGHSVVSLCKDKQVYRKYIHHLVLETFIGKCPRNMECRHLDGDPSNNRLSNLKWGTRSENHYDAVRHKTAPGLIHKGEKHYNTKLTEKDVRMIIYMYRTGLFMQKEIAKIYNVTSSAISLIICRKNWKHVWRTCCA